MNPITIWGRTSSSNVMKLLWLCEELGVAFERIDAGGAFGRTRDPDYLAMNPNAAVPTISEADGFSLWESNAIMRYICASRVTGTPLYPTEPRARADGLLVYAVLAAARRSSLHILAEPVYLCRQAGRRIPRDIEEPDDRAFRQRVVPPTNQPPRTTGVSSHYYFPV